MIDRILAMALVACDRRKNPAADLFARTASHACAAVTKFAEGLCAAEISTADSSERRRSVPQAQYAEKTYRVATASGKVVNVTGAYSSCRWDDAALRTPTPRRRAAAVPHCVIPDYTARIGATVERLRGEYRDQQSEIECTKREIDSHERIDLAQLDRELESVQAEIENCRSLENALERQRLAYRADGVVRNVLVHGFSQISLSRQMSKLRDKRVLLASKQAELEKQVAKRKSFGFASKRNLLKRQEDMLDVIARDYAAQKARLDGFRDQMKDCVDRMAETAMSLNGEIDRFNILSQYAAELDAAANPYERFLIHRKCEETFGSGSVGRLCGQARSRIGELAGRFDAQIRLAEIRAREIGLLV